MERDHYAYALLKPDVLIRGVLSNCLSALQSFGYEVYDFRIGLLTNKAYNQMYSTKFLWRLDHWAHNREAYIYGPSIGLILKCVADLPSGTSAQAHLSKVKGSALPCELKQKTIRAKAGATSRVFNTIHVPDEVNIALKEVKLWFGKSYDLTNVLALQNSTIEEEVKSHGYQTASLLNADITYLFVKARLMHSLRYLASDRSIKNMLSDIGVRLARTADSLKVGYDKESEKKILSEWQNHEVARLLEAMEACAGEASKSSVRHTLAFLCEFQSGGLPPENALSYFWNRLSIHQVYTTPLERYLIANKMLYVSQ